MKTIILMLVIAVTTAQAMPLSWLEDQACLRARLEVKMKNLSGDEISKEERDSIEPLLLDYIAKIQSNITWCKRASNPDD